VAGKCERSSDGAGIRPPPLTERLDAAVALCNLDADTAACACATRDGRPAACE
jgi:hypothetical protein